MKTFPLVLLVVVVAAFGQYPRDFDVSLLPLPPAYSTTIIPRNYTLFKQCDPAWGSDLMVSKTICAVGCLMSSCSMALRAFNVTLPAPSNPGTLNHWLQSHGGYDASNDLDENALQALPGVKYLGPAASNVPEAKIRAMLMQGTVVIANVMHGRHFVLVVGFDNVRTGFFYVNDPGFPVTIYKLSDMVGWRLISMTPQ